MDGVLNIFKNKKMTSFDVVRKVKKIAHEKKVGHTGTLDPEATGVLPVCLGKATKIIDYIMNDDNPFLAHKSEGWTESDPKEFTDWFLGYYHINKDFGKYHVLYNNIIELGA